MAPGNYILENGEHRARYVTDWSNDDAALNLFLFDEPTNYATISIFVGDIRPGTYIYGWDIKDCFSLWPVCPIFVIVSVFERGIKSFRMFPFSITGFKSVSRFQWSGDKSLNY